MRKLIAMLMCLAMLLSAVPGLAEDAAEDGVIRLDVYSQMANFSGIQQGWGATLLKDYAAKCADIVTMDKNPKLEGRNMSMFLSPKAK